MARNPAKENKELGWTIEMEVRNLNFISPFDPDVDELVVAEYRKKCSRKGGKRK